MGTGSMDDNAQRLEPLRARATSSSTLDSTTSSVDSGRSTPTPVSVAESNLSITPVQLKPPSVEMNKAKVRPTAFQHRNHNEASRRSKNTRRGKKTDTAGASPREAGPPTTPSRRWDALKPASRASGGSRRSNYTSSNKPLLGHAIGDQDSKESTASNRQEATAQSLSNGYLISSDRRQTNQHATSFRNFSGDTCSRDSAQLVSNYSTDFYSNAHSTSLETPPLPRANVDAYSGIDDTSNTPLLFSSLNPESPSWEDRQVRTRTSRVATPIRPPPGMESVPYGCESSDGVSVSVFPYQTLPTSMDVATVDRSTPSPFLPPGPESFYAPQFDNARTILPFCFHSQHSSHVKENPFAASSDDDDVDEKIAADLQELGGQMVGSILDF